MKLHRDEGDGIVLLAAAVVLLIVRSSQTIIASDCMLYDSSSPEVVQRQIEDLIAYKNVNDLPLHPSSRLYESV
jgi:hypothetical protein